MYLDSYQTAENFFSRCRFPEKGRPLKNWGRLFRDGDDYVLRITGWRTVQDLCRISPDNKLTFVMPLADFCVASQSLTQAMDRYIPIHTIRQAKGVYRVGSDQEFKTRKVSDPQDLRWYHDGYRWLKNEAPQYFKGIQFDLTTGECLNAQPDEEETIIPEERRAWLRDLKRFKKGLKARAKVGALRGFIDAEAKAMQEHKQSFRHYRREITPHWQSAELTQLVMESMRDEKYPAEILQALVRAAVVEAGRYSYGTANATVDDTTVLRAVDRVFDANSRHFRRAYGVFGLTIYEKT